MATGREPKASPISERTAELNLTVELVNSASRKMERRCVAWCATLRDNGSWGFDAAHGLRGGFVYLQIKQAHEEAPGFRYELNRTSAEDQHKKLQALERAGCAVWYLLPQFTTLEHVEQNRGRLLQTSHAHWYRPSAIAMPGDGVGRHDLHVHPQGAWLSAPPVRVAMPESQDPLLKALEQRSPLGANELRWEALFKNTFGDDPSAGDGGIFLFVPA